MSPPARGFTLLEALLALSLLALLSLLGYRGMSSLLDAQAQVTAASEQWGRLDQLFARIEADLRAAIPRAARMGGSEVPAFFAGRDAGGGILLALSRAGAEFSTEPNSPGQRIAYRWRPSGRGGELDLLYWPALDNIGPQPAQALQVTDALTDLRWRLLDRRGEWHEHWPLPDDDAVPRAVSLALRLRSGESVERVFALR